VHTIMHLASSLLQDPGPLLDTTATVLSAAIGAGCRRIIWLSHLGAEAVGENDWLAACAEIEELLAEAPLESIVFRRSLTYGPHDDLTTSLTAMAVDGASPAPGARHAPLYADDLAQAIAAADQERILTGPVDLHLVIPIAGPDVLDLAEVVSSLRSGAGTSGGHRSLPEHAIELLSRDLLPPAGALGAQGTPFVEGARRVTGAPVW
jgi:uncharacterized protein YbjT (DUF2867 family)